MTRADRHAAFARLHDRSSLFILPNAWDAASARLIADVGAKAIATTSSGVANVLGYPDGNKLPVTLVIEAIQRVVAAVEIPVTADIEEGFSENPSDVADLVSAVAEAGAVGINLEDGVKPPELLVAKIEAIRARLDATGTPLFINARVDPYLRGHETPLKEALRRAPHYLKAGANGIFVPFISKPDEIRTLCTEVAAPVNVLLRPGLPPAAELFQLGVARFSAGHMIYSAAMGFVRKAAQGFLETGETGPIFENAMPREVSQRLFS